MKSYAELNVTGTYFLSNLSNLITIVFYNEDKIFENKSNSYLSLYKDFHGWEFFIYYCNGDIAFLHTALKLYEKINGKKKLARYQVFEIGRFYNLKTDSKMSQDDLEKILKEKLLTSSE